MQPAHKPLHVLSLSTLWPWPAPDSLPLSYSVQLIINFVYRRGGAAAAHMKGSQTFHSLSSSSRMWDAQALSITDELCNVH